MRACAAVTPDTCRRASLDSELLTSAADRVTENCCVRCKSFLRSLASGSSDRLGAEQHTCGASGGLPRFLGTGKVHSDSLEQAVELPTGISIAGLRQGSGSLGQTMVECVSLCHSLPSKEITSAPGLWDLPTSTSEMRAVVAAAVICISVLATRCLAEEGSLQRGSCALRAPGELLRGSA